VRVQLLRETLRLTGTHVGCDTFAVRALRRSMWTQGHQGLNNAADAGRRRRRVTIEGLLANGEHLASDEEAFRENNGLAMRICTPGMIMTAVDMVNGSATRSSGNHSDELEGTFAGAPATTKSSNTVAAGAKRHGQRAGPATGGRVRAATQ